MKFCIFSYILAPIAYVVPIVYGSCYNYITSDYSPDAFQLFYPTVYVKLSNLEIEGILIKNCDFFTVDYRTIGECHWDIWLLSHFNW